MDFSGFNLLEVIVAAASAFALGSLWYGPLFGKRWQSLNNLSDEEIGSGHPGKIYGTAFLLNVFIALMMSAFIEVAMMLGSGALVGFAFGAFLGLIFVAPTFAINYLFAQRPLPLWLIDAGYMVTQFGVMGAILGAWT